MARFQFAKNTKVGGAIPPPFPVLTAMQLSKLSSRERERKRDNDDDDDDDDDDIVQHTQHSDSLHVVVLS